jgi:hypothetical protein
MIEEIFSCCKFRDKIEMSWFAVNRWCLPAKIYFYVSMLAIAIAIWNNLQYQHYQYKMGTFACKVPNTLLIFAIKIIYILFWTWILQLICKEGYSNLSWFLVLFPFLLAGLIVWIVMMNQ